MPAHPPDPAYAMVPLSQVAREFSRSRRTVTRWIKVPGFPPTFKICGKNYVERAALEAWKARQRCAIAPVSAAAEEVGG